MEDGKVILLKDLQITSMDARDVFHLLIAFLILNMVVHATWYGICTLLIWQVAKFGLRHFFFSLNFDHGQIPSGQCYLYIGSSTLSRGISNYVTP